MSRWVRAVGTAHAGVVFRRRVRALVRAIDALLPPEVESLADVGCGDGSIGAALATLRPGLAYRGLDVFARPGGKVPVEVFDGRRLPLADRSVDAVMFVDVLHHARDPHVLLSEARRVARTYVLVKDHLADRPWAEPVLSLMDWVGNRPHGVTMTWEYWSSERWADAWRKAGLRPVRVEEDLHLYAPPLRPLFEWGLHHLTLLVPQE